MNCTHVQPKDRVGFFVVEVGVGSKRLVATMCKPHWEGPRGRFHLVFFVGHVRVECWAREPFVRTEGVPRRAPRHAVPSNVAANDTHHTSKQRLMEVGQPSRSHNRAVHRVHGPPGCQASLMEWPCGWQLWSVEVRLMSCKSLWQTRKCCVPSPRDSGHPARLETVRCLRELTVVVFLFGEVFRLALQKPGFGVSQE